MNIDFRKEPSFEEAYPKAPFSELIRLALAAAEGLCKRPARGGSSGSSGIGPPAPVGIPTGPERLQRRSRR